MDSKRVQLLNTDVAEKIAAGEVIERPFSVVKELLENAIDAQATEIHVRLESGGKSLIEITDNGTGMTREDLRLCVQRHATSKFREFEDFNTLSTLGFRGEALPSIRAVSQLEITTRHPDENSTWQWTDIAGEGGAIHTVQDRHFLGSAHGSSVRVAQLFHNIPVRWKFLRSDKSETMAIREWIERIALCHPKIGFHFETEHQKIRWAPNDSAHALEHRFRQICLDGTDTPIEILRGKFEDGEWSLLWGKGRTTASSKKVLQRVNGRVLRDRLLQPVMLQAFRQHLLPGQYPILFLTIDMDPSALDVNIHPTKTEVRFLRPNALISSLHTQMGGMLQSTPSPVWVAGAETQGFDFADPRPAFSSSAEVPPAEPGILPFHAAHPLSQSRYVGDLFATFALFERMDTSTENRSLWLLDQHAAHERIRFEKLRDNPWGESQPLLLPITVQAPSQWAHHAALIVESLNQHGFECEAFSESSIVVRAVPSAWDVDPLEPRLHNLLDQLVSKLEKRGSGALASDLERDDFWDQTLFEVFASEACHSAIRAGDRIHEWEARSLVDQLFACKHPWNCPHGRPTLVEIPKSRFETWFQRRAPQSSES